MFFIQLTMASPSQTDWVVQTQPPCLWAIGQTLGGHSLLFCANYPSLAAYCCITDCDYCATTFNALVFRQKGLKVSGYHANLDMELRTKIHHKWLSGEYQAIVATTAFGMGIDKPDVRFVIHHALSKSMESFYQVVYLMKTFWCGKSVH